MCPVIQDTGCEALFLRHEILPSVIMSVISKSLLWWMLKTHTIFSTLSQIISCTTSTCFIQINHMVSSWHWHYDIGYMNTHRVESVPECLFLLGLRRAPEVSQSSSPYRLYQINKSDLNHADADRYVLHFSQFISKQQCCVRVRRIRGTSRWRSKHSCTFQYIKYLGFVEKGVVFFLGC